MQNFSCSFIFFKQNFKNLESYNKIHFSDGTLHCNPPRNSQRIHPFVQIIVIDIFASAFARLSNCSAGTCLLRTPTPSQQPFDTRTLFAKNRNTSALPIVHKDFIFRETPCYIFFRKIYQVLFLHIPNNIKHYISIEYFISITL